MEKLKLEHAFAEYVIVSITDLILFIVLLLTFRDLILMHNNIYGIYIKMVMLSTCSVIFNVFIWVKYVKNYLNTKKETVSLTKEERRG